jgi:DNA-directed RNA polymerase subunit A'
MLQKRIAAIEFRVLDPQTIRKMSAIEIKNPETYDKDGYPMEEGLMDAHLGVINPGLRCKTCGQTMHHCPGHFGHFELVRPVIHAEFSKRIEDLLVSTCKECGRIALPKKELEKFAVKAPTMDSEELVKKIRAKAKKKRRCPHCGAMRGEITLDKPTNFYYNKNRIYPSEIREWLEKIPDEDLQLMGYNTKIVKPEWFVLTVLPIPPITIRPSITLESGIKSEDDLTHKLVDIIRINERLRDNIEAGAPQLIIEDLWDLLQYHVTTYFNNQIGGVPPAKHRSGRPLRTITQRLKGKKGRFRHNLTGKRVNFAARSTITPDPYLSINEVGVPEMIAKELTLPESVTEWNLKRMKSLVKNTDLVVSITRPDGIRKRVTSENKAEVAEELAPGYRIERRLMDGDIVMFNRQPSLHRLSMLGHIVRITPDKTLKLNPAVCKPYNADFDGDEMNLHVPQSEEGKAEARELMLVEHNVISPRYGAPIVILAEDGVSGTFLLTNRSTVLNREEAMRLFYEFDIKELPEPDKGKYYSGKLVFSALLPKDLNIEYQSKICEMIKQAGLCEKCVKEACPYDAYVKIVNGRLVCGVIDDRSLGEAKGKLVDVLAREYPPEVIRNFYDKISRVVNQLLTIKGLTVGLDEYEISDRIERIKEKAIKDGLKKAEQIVELYRQKRLKLIPGRTLEESFEMRMMQTMQEAKQKVERELIKEKLQEVLRDPPKFNSTLMIMCGSRGSAVNLTNMMGLWGQASVREGRPKRGFRNRLIAHNKPGDVGAFAGGFIVSNFMKGLSPKEYFYHSIGGRQGEVDTGVSTKVSGYLYRRLANSLKDLSIHADGTVRTGNKRLIEYIYGEDGVFPMHGKMGKAIDIDYAVIKIKAITETKNGKKAR